MHGWQTRGGPTAELGPASVVSPDVDLDEYYEWMDYHLSSNKIKKLVNNSNPPSISLLYSSEGREKQNDQMPGTLENPTLSEGDGFTWMDHLSYNTL